MHGKYLNMIITLVAYFITFYVVVRMKNNVKQEKQSFPNLKLNKRGISFFSLGNLSIRIEEVKVAQIGNVLYIKTKNDLVLIQNVKNAKLIENQLYFECLGEVDIFFDCRKYYKYFLIEIKSRQFDFRKEKQNALIDIINHNFNIKESAVAKKYITIIQRVLNIKIGNEKITVGQNKFRFSYVLIYKLNNVIKRVTINERI